MRQIVRQKFAVYIMHSHSKKKRKIRGVAGGLDSAAKTFNFSFYIFFLCWRPNHFSNVRVNTPSGLLPPSPPPRTDSRSFIGAMGKQQHCTGAPGVEIEVGGAAESGDLRAD